MKKASAFRLIAMLGSLAWAAYLLSPIFLPLDKVRADYEKKGVPAPFYLDLLPKEGLNLGLDLRGGIYLELEADVLGSFKKRLAFMAAEVARDAKDEPFVPQKVDLVENDQLEVVLKTPGDRAAFKDWFGKRYRQVWQQAAAEESRLVYGLNNAYKERMTSDIMAQAIESVRNRVDRYGVAEASISRYGSDRMVVELPGVHDPERVINIIRQTGQLEFKIVNTALDQAALKTLIAETRKSANLTEAYDKAAVDALNLVLKDKLPPDTELAFELNREPQTKKVQGGVPYLLNKKAEITGDLLENAQAAVQDNEPHVSLSHNPTGTRLLAEVTKENVNKQLAIVLDGNVIKAPVIREPIPNGQAQITFGFGNYESLLQEAKDLALILREGALPASLNVVKRSLIGPSLGADSIRDGVIASLIGGVLVVLFMAAYYKTSGVVADISLIFNMAILLGILSLLSASLTLPGIAGIALTIGMAVDANVVIFERIKDELALDLPLKAAFERGYANAMSAVLDSNITTFIAGIVLYQFGTGPIKGFATTLMIGIGSTLITAVLFSRWIQEMLLEKSGWSKIRI
jgi:protein-export membrane protein SecD